VLPYILRRVAYSVPVLLVASFLTYCGLRLTFDPLSKIRENAQSTHQAPAVTQRLLHERRHALHLDENIVAQWGHWLGSFLHGNMGVSDETHESVARMIQHALWPTLQLMFWGTIVSLVLAIAVGVYSAIRQYTASDYALTSLSYLGIAMPPFAFAILAIAYFTTWPVEHFHLHGPILYTVGLHSTGASGFNLDYARHLVLPVATLTIQGIAAWSRFLRGSMLDVMDADFVRTARAKGVPGRRVIFRHAFRNALIPFTTVVALDTAALVGGLIVTEVVFSIPGMGQLFVTALRAGDAPTLLAWFLLTASTVIAFNLAADIFYGVLDPRIRVT